MVQKSKCPPLVNKEKFEVNHRDQTYGTLGKWDKETLTGAPSLAANLLMQLTPGSHLAKRALAVEAFRGIDTLTPVTGQRIAVIGHHLL